MGALKWAIATIVFAAMSWALYAVARHHDDSWLDDGPVFLTLSAMSAIFAMIGLLFLIKEI
nr:MAG TPA: hypothetical protein [Caudoviricetes sp.]